MIRPELALKRLAPRTATIRTLHIADCRPGVPELAADEAEAVAPTSPTGPMPEPRKHRASHVVCFRAQELCALTLCVAPHVFGQDGDDVALLPVVTGEEPGQRNSERIVDACESRSTEDIGVTAPCPRVNAQVAAGDCARVALSSRCQAASLSIPCLFAHRSQAMQAAAVCNGLTLERFVRAS